MPEPARNAPGGSLIFTIRRNKTAAESLLSEVCTVFYYNAREPRGSQNIFHRRIDARAEIVSKRTSGKVYLI